MNTNNPAESIQQVFSEGAIRLIRELGRIALRKGELIYLVGGCVRDLVIGTPVTDLDLVLEGDASVYGKRVVGTLGGTVITHPDFHTAKWNPGKDVLDQYDIRSEERAIFKELDLISARKETYPSPAALPVVRLDHIRADLERRDFTINTMALRVAEAGSWELLDPFNGAQDISNGLVRILHPRSFIDDPTRLFRAVRYEQRYGFSLSSETEGQVGAALPGIALLSPERVRHELDLILQEPRPQQCIERLVELGILAHVEKNLPWNAAIASRMERGLTRLAAHLGTESSGLAGWILWLMRLSEGAFMKIDRRLHFERRTADAIRGAIDILKRQNEICSVTPGMAAEILDGYPKTMLNVLAAGSRNAGTREVLQKYLEQWSKVKVGISGKTLIARGLEPGPAYQQILRAIRRAWLDGEIATPEQEEVLLKKLLNSL